MFVVPILGLMSKSALSRPWLDENIFSTSSLLVKSKFQSYFSLLAFFADIVQKNPLAFGHHHCNQESVH